MGRFRIDARSPSRCFSGLGGAAGDVPPAKAAGWVMVERKLGVTDGRAPSRISHCECRCKNGWASQCRQCCATRSAPLIPTVRRQRLPSLTESQPDDNPSILMHYINSPPQHLPPRAQRARPGDRRRGQPSNRRATRRTKFQVYASRRHPRLIESHAIAAHSSHLRRRRIWTAMLDVPLPRRRHAASDRGLCHVMDGPHTRDGGEDRAARNTTST